MDDEIFTTEAGRRRLAQEWLASWLRTRRWFGAKDRPIRDCRIVRHTAVGQSWLCAVEVQFDDGARDAYLLPLTRVSSAEAAAVVATVSGGVLVDATHVPAFRAALFQVLAGREFADDLTVEGNAALAEAANDPPVSRVLTVEQGNSSIVYGDRWLVKLFRKLEAGANPEVEMARFLGVRAEFPHTPPFHGTLSWGGSDLALVNEFLPDAVDGWELALHYRQQPGDPAMREEWRKIVQQLGERAGEMHLALANAADDPAFSPEPITRDDVETIMRSMLETARTALGELEGPAASQLPDGESLLREFFTALQGMQPIQRLLDQVQALPPEGVKIRVHGDFHLGHVRYRPGEILFSNFEGEPLRTTAQRRAKQPPVRDVAAMLRSLAYAQASADPLPLPWTNAAADQAAFLTGWRSRVGGTALAAEFLLPIFLLEKAFYELSHELKHRPDWAHIPMRGIIALCRSLE